jgi:hypothetical protein
MYTSTLLSDFIFLNTLYMSLGKPTTSQIAHQRIVIAFGNLVQSYNKGCLTHIFQVLVYSAVTHCIGYEVHQ